MNNLSVLRHAAPEHPTASTSVAGAAFAPGAQLHRRHRGPGLREDAVALTPPVQGVRRDAAPRPVRAEVNVAVLARPAPQTSFYTVSVACFKVVTSPARVAAKAYRQVSSWVGMRVEASKLPRFFRRTAEIVGRKTTAAVMAIGVLTAVAGAIVSLSSSALALAMRTVLGVCARPLFGGVGLLGRGVAKAFRFFCTTEIGVCLAGMVARFLQWRSVNRFVLRMAQPSLRFLTRIGNGTTMWYESIRGRLILDEAAAYIEGLAQGEDALCDEEGSVLLFANHDPVDVKRRLRERLPWVNRSRGPSEQELASTERIVDRLYDVLCKSPTAFDDNGRERRRFTFAAIVAAFSPEYIGNRSTVFRRQIGYTALSDIEARIGSRIQDAVELQRLAAHRFLQHQLAPLSSTQSATVPENFWPAALVANYTPTERRLFLQAPEVFEVRALQHAEFARVAFFLRPTDASRATYLRALRALRPDPNA